MKELASKQDSMINLVTSRGGIPIRLTDERWTHIVEEHGELVGMRAEVLQTISDAARIVTGGVGELLAIRMVEAEKALVVVVYRETSAEDGFVITAFLTRRLGRLDRRQQIWPSKI
jgi:hypothetical protein